MELGPGLAAGLSFSNQTDQRVNDLYRRDEYERRVKGEAIARAKLQADELQYQHATNPFDDNLIKQDAKKIIGEIGRYRQENPDWEWNTDKRQLIQSKLNDLRNNPNLVRSVQVNDAYKEYLKDRQEAAKNPTEWDTEALDEQGKQFDRYFQSGHPMGPEAANNEGYKAVVYTRPKMLVNVPDTLLKTGSTINNFNAVKPKDGNPGEYYTEPKSDELDALTDAQIAQNGRSIYLHAQKLGLNDPQQIRDFVKNGIKAGFKQEYHIGDANAAWNRNMQMMNYYQRDRLAEAKQKAKSGAASYTPFDYLTDPRNKAGTDSSDDISKMLGDKPSMILTGTQSGQRYDLSGEEWRPIGKYLNKGGITLFLGNAEIPLARAYEKGIINEYNKSDEDEAGATEARIRPDFKGQATFMTKYKDGKPYKVVQVSYNFPVNPNDQNLRQKWNAFKDVDKLVPASQDPFQSEVYEGSADEFKSSGWSDEQIREGVRQGKIKVK